MKMTNTNSIKMYRYKQFESAPSRTDEYINFERRYINFFKRLCKNNEWELAKVYRGHFECDVYIKNGDRHACVLLSDVRFPLYGRSWYEQVCYRRCNDTDDTIGETNRWTSFDNLEEELQRLLNE